MTADTFAVSLYGRILDPLDPLSVRKALASHPTRAPRAPEPTTETEQ